jgi:branched-chain amino acid transport system permease protein
LSEKIRVLTPRSRVHESESDIVDYIGFAISFGSIYGIYAILGISLNLEYGYGGQPNFGQVLFFGLGVVVGATVAADLIPTFAGVAVGDICDVSASLSRQSIALANPAISVSVWVIALLLAMVSGGVVGIVASYPALRVREEWFLSMILLVGGETFRIVVTNTPQIGCGFNGLAGINTPFYWLSKFFQSSTLQSEVPTGLYAAVIIAIALGCFVIAQRFGNSPYGRLLKSVRDDKVAAASLGKDVSRVRRQVMFVGSVMAGLAGGLYVYYIGVATAEDFVPAVTFSVWVMMILGGYANNRGLLVGTFIITLLDRGSAISSLLLEPYLPNSNANFVIYGRYMVEATVLLLLLMFRRKGIFPETRIKTKAYTLFDFGGKIFSNAPGQEKRDGKGATKP